MKMSNKKFIKKMDNYFDMMSEAFDNPLDIKWVDKNPILRGLFTINDNIYQIVCENKDNNIWKYDFYFYEKDKKFSPELTGFEKDKFRVLPTIENGIEYLYNNKKVDCIIFGSSDKSKGRKKLYTAFCEKFCEKNNLEFYTKVYNSDDIDRQIFVLYKEDIDKDILSETILKILEEEKFGN
jgi:hypothetical protein